MPSIPNNQLLDVEVISTGVVAAAGSNSKQSVSVYHFHTSANSNNKNKTNVINAFHTAIGSLLYAAFNVRYTEQNTSARWLNDALDLPTVVGFSHAGAIAGDSMATSLSAYIKLTTGLRGKSYRGSKKLFPLSESDTTLATDDELNAAALARFAAIAAAILAGFTDSDGNVWQSSIVSRKLSQLKSNPTTVSYALVTAAAARKTIGSMRRRKVKSQY